MTLRETLQCVSNWSYESLLGLYIQEYGLDFPVIRGNINDIGEYYGSFKFFGTHTQIIDSFCEYAREDRLSDAVDFCLNELELWLEFYLESHNL